MDAGILATLGVGLFTGFVGFMLKWVWGRLNRDIEDLKKEIRRLDCEDKRLQADITSGQLQAVRIEAALKSFSEMLERLGNEFSGLRGDIQRSLGTAAALEEVAKALINSHKND